ncbi:preprotein translocase subunit SecG [Parvularcula flava]|uniref:Protein-export membrane protein SecG n=1 Tax=Aquisalinus luteolus TaxID=1566827 RepID=A0A8J3A6X0_9PROT|nr:preprotein translocase subunit SecG [Aquisalinus luteolus]NHK27689.1 preprotein translocase subunit SecG [Aquisalinus luteolus]GGH96200.1 preprotein translocase subunit SecG [Aquisalinus luteolus]
METIILIIYCFIVIALVGVVLMQRSEGGALGMGGGGGGVMSGRGAASALTRTTSLLAAAYMGICLFLAVIAKEENPNQDFNEILGNDPAAPSRQLTPGEVTGDDLLDGFGTTDEPAEEPVTDEPLLEEIAPVETAPATEESSGDPAADSADEETPEQP